MRFSAEETMGVWKKLLKRFAVGAVCFIVLAVFGSNPVMTQSQRMTTGIIEGITMVYLPAGSFLMGSNEGPPNERPAHTVEIAAFSIGATEITQGQYKAVTGTNPSNYVGDDNLPVEQVTWYDAVRFCNLLSDRAGLERCYDENTWECDTSKNGLRLPTEAEWEYACRAGSTTAYNTGDTESVLDDTAWYGNINNGNSYNMPHPVGMWKPNAWGLYDMHGSLWEWCSDRYRETYNDLIPEGETPGPHKTPTRVMRGGSWISDPEFCRSATRDFYSPDISYLDLGFRVARSGTR